VSFRQGAMRARQKFTNRARQDNLDESGGKFHDQNGGGALPDAAKHLGTECRIDYQECYYRFPG
jgi:hypothetical protein